MNISIESNIKSVLSEFGRFAHTGVPFAIKAAINDTLFEMRKDLPAEIEKEFDKPVPFTKSPYAWDIEKANTQQLTAVLKMKPLQSAYMRFQVFGGTEYPKRRGIPVPSAGGGLRASHGGLKKTWKTVANDKAYFSGKPRGAKWASAPAGIYKRMGGKVNKRSGKKSATWLKKVLSWESSTQYQKAWDFHAYAAARFQRGFTVNFRKRMAAQIAKRS